MNTPSKNDWILEWLAFAKSDRDLARSVLEGEELDIRHAAFHLQQAVEKSLKAALISEGLDPPYTHDLEELIELLPSSWEGDFLN